MTPKRLATRQRIIDAAGQSFRSNGYAGIGVDGIAKAAGVTSGAFYAHLGSKDKAFEVALISGLDEVIAAVPVFQADHNEEWVKAFANYYLGRAHREDLAYGCAMTTLSPEVVRTDENMRATYESKMKKIVKLLAIGLADGSVEEKQARAWALLGTLIGGLTMARAVKSKSAADTIAATIITSAVNIAGNTELKSAKLDK